MRPQYQKYETPFLTIDPGSRENGGIGIAMFNESGLLSTFKIQAKGNWEERVDKLMEHFQSMLDMTGDIIKTAFVEQPRYFDSYKGHTSANTQSLFKLINVYSRIEQIIKSNNIVFLPISILTWKGQLSKKQTLVRVKRICGENFLGVWTEDQIDAIGLGYHILGKF